MYQYRSEQHELDKRPDNSSFPLSISFKSDTEPSDNIELMSTSIDRLLDSFFTNNNNNNVKTLTMNDLSLNSSLNYQRTKSISISGNITDLKEKGVDKQPGAFSLSDLANEYLASASNMTPSTNNPTPLGSSLADLIDYEFSQRLSISEDQSYRKSETEIDEALNPKINHIELNKESLMIRRERSRFSASYEISSSVSSTTSSTYLSNNNNGNSSVNQNIALNKIQLISNKQEIDLSKLVSNMFEVESESLIGDFLTFETRDQNATNKLFEDDFSYKKQAEKYRNKSRSSRRKFVFDLEKEKYLKEKSKLVNTISRKKKISESSSSRNHKDESVKSSSAVQNDTVTDRQSKASYLSSSSSKAISSKKSGSKSSLRKVQIFDFSIPSPDDVVIAKQRFAFKNMRFK